MEFFTNCYQIALPAPCSALCWTGSFYENVFFVSKKMKYYICCLFFKSYTFFVKFYFQKNILFWDVAKQFDLICLKKKRNILMTGIFFSRPFHITFILWASSIMALGAIGFHLGLMLWCKKTFDMKIPFSELVYVQGPRKGLLRNNNDCWGCGTNYLDASRAAFTHSIRHSGTRRINHGDEAQKAELLGGEVRVIAVELKSSRKLRGREIQVAESWKGRGGSVRRVHKMDTKTTCSSLFLKYFCYVLKHINCIFQSISCSVNEWSIFELICCSPLVAY